MISNAAKHKEKMKLSDKFAQPFVVGTPLEVVGQFNAKLQKKISKRKRK